MNDQTQLELFRLPIDDGLPNGDNLGHLADVSMS